MDSEVLWLWLNKSSVSAAELNFELKPQANDIRISSNWIYDVILPPIDRIWSNKMKHNRFFFCLDDNTPRKILAQSNGRIENYDCCGEPGLLCILRQNPNLTLLGSYHKAEPYQAMWLGPRLCFPTNYAFITYTLYIFFSF
jgi:hypothetical protein